MTAGRRPARRLLTALSDLRGDRRGQPRAVRRIRRWRAVQRRLRRCGRAAAAAPLRGVHIRDHDTLADLHHRVGRNIVGLGKHHHRFAVEARDAVQRLARRHDVNACGRRQRGPRRTDRPGGGIAGAVEAMRVCGGRKCRRRAAATRNHQMLAWMYRRRIADVVGLHDRGHRHAVPARNRFEGLAGAKRDRRAAFPCPGTAAAAPAGSEPVTSSPLGW